MKNKSRIYLKIRIAVVLAFLITSNCYAQQTISDKLVLPEQQENHWWVGIINHGDLMPIEDGYQSNMYGNNYGADGFKFDAGDAKRYNDIFSYKPIGPNQHSRLFGLFDLDFPLNEYHAMWKMGGQPLIQRLRDKGHDWKDLHKLIPHILLQGIMGYPFTCPDMIGGGQFRSFLNSSSIDQELIVRSAQSHALMPMMQFSVAPWRVLDEKHLKACKLAVEIRQNYLDRILQLTNSSAQTGEPVVRSLEYVFPHQGYEKVEDQFMLGNKILVCPMLEKGKTGRTIVLPKGSWRSDTGKIYNGPTQIETEVPLHRLPVFEKLL